MRSTVVGFSSTMRDGQTVASLRSLSLEPNCGLLCYSPLCWAIFAPLLALGAAVLLGWNEQRAVCGARPFDPGRPELLERGCDGGAAAGTADGEFALVSCDLSTEGLPTLSPSSSVFDGLVSFVGVGLDTTVEMFQCIENIHEEEVYDNTSMRRVAIFSFSHEWRSSWVNSTAFYKRTKSIFYEECGIDNPQWPPGLPESGIQRAQNPTPLVGGFGLSEEFAAKIPLNSVVKANSTPSGWVDSGEYYTSSEYAVWDEEVSIGMIRVRFRGNDWSVKRVTALGEVRSGALHPYVEPDSWLCDGYSLGDLRLGNTSKQRLLSELRGEEQGTLGIWVVRVVGLLMCWIAFWRILGPIGMATDCAFCVGSLLGPERLERISACVAILPACACTLGVLGAVWVVPSPFVGVPFLVVCCSTCCSLFAYEAFGPQPKGLREDSLSSPCPSTFGTAA